MANVCIPPARVAELKAQVAKGEINAKEISKMLPEEKAALKTLLEDFVTKKLNVTATSGEIKTISKMAKKIDEAQAKLGEDLGDPSKINETVDFFKAKKDMDNYLQSHNPAPRTRVLTGTIGRGMMLFSAKSPILNIGSNIEIGLTEGLGRRIASRGVRGTDRQLFKQYTKMVNKVYRETGYDLSRMTSISDLGANGGRVLDDVVHAQGKGATRKTGRVVEDVVFKNLMGAPDVYFGGLHFADSVNINALRLAKGNKVKAKTYMKDSMLLEPKTPEGMYLRDQGILDAQVATWTNKTWGSRATIGIRRVLNDLTGNLRLGDFVMPFVKTPANVIATGVDYAGGGLFKAMAKTVKGIRSGTIKDPIVIKQISRDATRAGMGLTLAAVFAYNLKPEDFMGAYDPARAQIEQLKNSRENSVRIGGKWISTDWFGPVSVPLTAMMYAKKYGGDTPKGKVFNYGKGITSAVLNLPGVEDVTGAVQNEIKNRDQTAEEAQESFTNYVTTQATTRLTPSFLADAANAADPYQRKVDKGIAGVKNKIPGVRNTLPIKRDIFGDPIKGEHPVSELGFGARVKSSRETPVTKEIDKVSKDSGKNIKFTDWDKSTSKSLAEFKAKVGQEKFEKAKIEYGQKLKKSLEETFKKPAYKKLSDEDKAKVIGDKDTKIQKEVFKQYNFKPTKTKSKKINL